MQIAFNTDTCVCVFVVHCVFFVQFKGLGLGCNAKKVVCSNNMH